MHKTDVAAAMHYSNRRLYSGSTTTWRDAAPSQ
jgi:hypothetical protein